jgi:hypothetical protein
VSTLIALLLPLLAWLAWYQLCRELAARQRIHPDWRLSWILASVAWGALLTLIVEASSLFHAFTTRTVAAAWIVADAALVSSAAALAARRIPFDRVGFENRRASLAARAHAIRRETSSDAKVFLLGTAGLVIGLALVAILTSCTNYDSMTYHLSRVAQWVAHRSVAHYPTQDWRQLEFGPWAEFAVANFYLLEWDDRLANLVQWSSMLTSIVAACLIARQLLPGWLVSRVVFPESPTAASTGRRATTLTAVLVATIPIGIAQSVTTQNDYVVACWFVCAVSLSAALYYDPENVWYTLCLGGALALGFLTKSIMAVFVAPFIAVLMLFLLWRLPTHRQRLRLLLILAIVFIAINGPHMARNYALLGSPMGSNSAMQLLRNRGITLSGTASNVIRNLSLYTATGIEPLSGVLDDTLKLAHKLTGRELNDPDLTFSFTPFSMYHTFVVGDSGANSAYHLLLVFLALLLLIWHGVPRRRVLWGYGALTAASFVLFCGMLRWQPWHSRFHLGQFILFMPFVAVVLVSTLPRWLTMAIGCGFLALGIVCVKVDVTRPITSDFLRLPRERQYFQARPAIYEGYRATINDIVASGCRKVGLYIPFDEWEYPIWAMLRTRGFEGDVYSIGVEGPSARLRPEPPAPCAMITAAPAPPVPLIHQLPVHTSHPGLDIWWTESASRWIRLTRTTADGQVVLSSHERDLALDREGLVLKLRTSRSGVLTLSVQTQGLAGHHLELRTSAGMGDTTPLDGQPVTFQVRSAGGDMTIRLRLLERVHESAFLRDLTWAWTPDAVAAR